MEANVQILNVDTPTLNGNVYPRAVVEAALAKLNGKPLAVTHVDAFLDTNGVPRVTDAIGIASNLHLDEATSTVIAHVKVDVIPDDLKEGFVFRSAGFGTFDEATRTITEFTMSAVIIGKE